MTLALIHTCWYVHQHQQGVVVLGCSTYSMCWYIQIKYSEYNKSVLFRPCQSVTHVLPFIPSSVTPAVFIWVTVNHLYIFCHQTDLRCCALLFPAVFMLLGLFELVPIAWGSSICDQMLQYRQTLVNKALVGVLLTKQQQQTKWP